MLLGRRLIDDDPDPVRLKSGPQGLQVCDMKSGVVCTGRPKFGLQTHVQSLRSGSKTDVSAGGEVGGSGNLLKPKPVTVEPSDLSLAVGRNGDPDVVDSDYGHQPKGGVDGITFDHQRGSRTARTQRRAVVEFRPPPERVARAQGACSEAR